MTCSIEILVIALQLARGLVAAPVLPSARSDNLTLIAPAVVRIPPCMAEWVSGDFITRWGYSYSRAEQLRCQADMAEREEAEARARRADYQEFQRLAAMCGPSDLRLGSIPKAILVTNEAK